MVDGIIYSWGGTTLYGYGSKPWYGCSHQYTVEIYGYSSRETYGIIVFDSFPFNFE